MLETPGPAYSGRDATRTDDARDHESEGELTEQIEFYELGGGYLAVHMRRDYHDTFDRAFPVEQTPIGIVAVEDYDALHHTLRKLGFEDVDDLEISCYTYRTRLPGSRATTESDADAQRK